MKLSDVITALDVTVYPIIGLVAFVTVFLVAAWRAFRTSKVALNHYANLPLESGEIEQDRGTVRAGEQS